VPSFDPSHCPPELESSTVTTVTMDAQPIILLNGWPGVGKDTIAETLSLLIGDNKASMLDWSRGRGENFQPIPDDDEAAQKAQRYACLAGQVEHPSTFKKMVICTDCLSDTPLGRRLAQDFEVVAKRANRLLIPIYLECQVEENMRRLQQAERRVSLKDKSKSKQPLLVQCTFELAIYLLLRHVQVHSRQRAWLSMDC
jgi:hypothetical protein